MPNAVYGLVIFRFVAVYTHILEIPPCCRPQYTCWKIAMNTNVEGWLYQLEVEQSFCFKEPVQLSQCSSRRQQGFLITLEDGQPQRLLNDLARLHTLPDMLHAPALCVRLPAAFAYLVGVGSWSSFLLPKMPPCADEERRIWNTPLHRLGCRLPHPPPVLLRVPSLAGWSPEAANVIADHLRQFALGLDLTDPGELEKFQELHRSTSGLQEYIDEHDELSLRRMPQNTNEYDAKTVFEDITKKTAKMYK